MPRRDTLAGLVAADAATSMYRKNWVDAYPNELQAELHEIRRRLHAGEIVGGTIRGVTKSLKTRLAEQGFDTPGYGTIREWLARRS
jgi:hypothetical protein